MEITVNGQKKSVAESCTVADLLNSLSINMGSVVVERNLKIVHRNKVPNERLEEGDTVEIIRLVGGG